MTRRLFWQTAAALLGIVAVFAILFQVGSAVPEPATTLQPTPGGTYVEGVVGYAGLINPILAPQTAQAHPVDQELAALVFDGLTTLDPTGQVVPALATAWTAAEDGTTYEFHLRQDVVWHDGAPFTAADVLFTVQALQDPDFQGDPNLAELWRSVTAEQLDAYSVRFLLDKPFPSFLQYTTIGLLPAHRLGNVAAADLPADDFSTRRPIGTGRFQVESVTSDRVVLAASSTYWGPKPHVDHLEFWFYDDEAKLLLDFEGGEVDGFHPTGDDTLATVTRWPGTQIFSAQYLGYGLVYLNLRRDSLPFFQQREIRQALLYALDRPALIDEALAGQGLVADSPIPSISWAYDPTVRTYLYDPERAIGLLDASGWLDSDGDRIRDKDGVELSFELLASNEGRMGRLAAGIADQWRAVGVDATIRAVSPDAVQTFVRNRNFDAVLVDLVLTSDPDPYPLWHSTQADEPYQSFSGFASEEADLVMEEGRTTVDVERRAELYHTFQRIFKEEVPSLLIYYPIYTYVVGPQPQNVQLGPLLHTSDRFRTVADWYVLTSEVVITPTVELDNSQDQ